MYALSEQVIFTEPYCVAENNKWTSPQLEDDAKSLREDTALKTKIVNLKRKFATDASAFFALRFAHRVYYVHHQHHVRD